MKIVVPNVIKLSCIVTLILSLVVILLFIYDRFYTRESLNNAVYQKDFLVVNINLLLGRNPNLYLRTGENAVIASAHSELSIFKLVLLFGGDCKSTHQYDDNTILHTAVWYNCLDIASYILTNSMVDVDAKNRYGYTALHYAAKENNLHMVNLLIAAGSDIDSIDNYGKRPISYTNVEDIRSILDR